MIPVLRHLFFQGLLTEAQGLPIKALLFEMVTQLAGALFRVLPTPFGFAQFAVGFIQHEARFTQGFFQRHALLKQLF